MLRSPLIVVVAAAAAVVVVVVVRVIVRVIVLVIGLAHIALIRCPLLVALLVALRLRFDRTIVADEIATPDPN